MVKETGVSKSTTDFKINLMKIPDKYPKLKNSLLSVDVFKNYANTIKEICKDSGSDLNNFIFSMIYHL